MGRQPLPEGATRQFESWEVPTYTAFALSTLIVSVGLIGKQNTKWEEWSKDEAAVRNARVEAGAPIEYGKNYAGLRVSGWKKPAVGARPTCEEGDDDE